MGRVYEGALEAQAHSFDCYKHLHSFGLDDLPNLPGCGDISEDPEHTMFHCSKFAMERRNLNQTIGRSVSPKNIIAETLRLFPQL